MYTFQDFEKSDNKESFITTAIEDFRTSEIYTNAIKADAYNRQKNLTINNYVKTIFSLTGVPVEDFTASNNKIASNFFKRLNTQRCTYLLGNGVYFEDSKIKEKLGNKFDTDLKDAGYKALIHGISFGFWNVDRLYVFPVTEFCPLWNEEDGTLGAGIRFWRLAHDKPMYAVLYEKDGYTKYKSKGEKGLSFKIDQPKKAYKTKYSYTENGNNEEVIGEENYSSLPIVPLWGSSLHQSTLVGIQEAIDSYDLIRSGFANDLTDCSQIYWIIENCGGMDDKDLARFRDRLKINHIAEVDGDSGAKATPYTQDIPYQARKQYLDDIRSGIFEDFGGLDVHTIQAGATNDHIDASYQPLDEEADDFEYQVIEFIQQILSLIDIDAVPMFKRNRVSNQNEQTQMVLSASSYLDDETVLRHLPFITVDEIEKILEEVDKESQNNFESNFIEDEEEIEENSETNE